MRVRENPPPLTLRLLKGFVNKKSRVSTGFLRFFLVFSGIWAVLEPKWAEKGIPARPFRVNQKNSMG
jgi:hypothetical protein